MLLHEVLKNTGLTRKAVEYYIDQGLLSPQAQENGYRTFSEEDVSRLHAISVYRRLGVSIAEIRSVFSDGKTQTLNDLLVRRTLAVKKQKQQNDLLALLAGGADILDITPQLRALDARERIADRLLNAFPGCFGRYLMLHFSHFLDDPIKTPGQQEAYETIVQWLDALPSFELPEDLRSFLEEVTQDMDAHRMEDMHAAVIKASEDPHAYLSGHGDVIRRYRAIRETEEYRSSPAARLMETMQDFQRQSGYIDVFLPAMERLSPAYAAYRARLEKASDALLKIIGNETE